jgi:hypothetical protein
MLRCVHVLGATEVTMMSRVILPLIGLLLLGACAAESGSSGGSGGWGAPPGAFTYPPGLEPRRGAGSK